MTSAPSLKMLLAVVILALPSCRKAPRVAESQVTQPDPTWFEDITARSGIGFVHEAGGASNYFMPANVGSGVSLLDYDNDGRLDIYFVQNGGPESSARNALFHQEADGRFRDASAGSGLDVTGYGMGAAIADVTNDGWIDVLVTEYGRVRLFLNDGGRAFREVTATSGLDNPLWATSACFFDYDRDGWLDLVIANYVVFDPSRPCVDQTGKLEFCGPKAFPQGSATKLFRNRGGTGAPGCVFEDVTISSGLASVSGPGLGVVCADFQGDGWPDIFVTNDGTANRLWMNQSNGTFKEEAVVRGVAFNGMGQAQGNMGIVLGDLDGDRAFDLFVTHLIEETHALWQQTTRGFFHDKTAPSGMAAPTWHGTGFGTVGGDFTNRGQLDVAIANGAVRRNKLNEPDAKTIAAVGAFWAPYADRNQLFANNGAGKFRDVSAGNDDFCGTRRIARGLACGDLDNDGGLDLLVSNIASAGRVYRNVAPQRGHWLIVRVIDPALGGRDAYGAEITVATGTGRATRWCNPGSSYLSSNDPRAHFGLGVNAQAEEIEVLWPDGLREGFSAGEVDRVISLRKGEGTPKVRQQ